MKKIISILALVLAAASCSLFDEAIESPSKSTYADDIVFSNYTLAEYSVFGIGEIVSHTNSYRARLHCFYGMNTDVETYSSNSAGILDKDLAAADDRVRMSEYNSSTNDNQLNTATNGYNEIVAGIERANLCIKGLRAYGNVDSDKDMSYLLGEALTYRAFFYYELIKMWGEVPLRTEPVSSATIYQKKSDRDDIYKVVLADLEEAIGRLYWPGEADQTTRADRMNKAFAKALYARVALSAAGWAWRPAAGKVGTGDLGSLRLTEDPELSAAKLYPKALKHIDDIYTSKTASLEPSYETLWRKFNNSEHMTGTPEVLWVIPFSDGRGRWNYTHAYPHTAGGPWITNNSARGGGSYPTANLWFKYDKNDSRRDLTLVNMQWNGANQAWELRGAVNYWFWGKYRFEWMTTKPYDGGYDDGIKPIVIRYSDALLMGAELAACTGDLPKAKLYLGEVRDRAMAGKAATKYTAVDALTLGAASTDVQGMITDHANQGTILGAIFQERALELAGEFVRKQDLIRWGLLKTALDEESADLEKLAKMQGPYAAYAAYATERTASDDPTRTFSTYPLYWREKHDAGCIEFFGLEADEIGQAPADYTAAEPNGWKIQERYISSEAFRNSTTGAYSWDYFYRNSFDDPYPRSVWPMYDRTMSAMQGALVNDYGYAQYK
ncbi:MAG: RagB/SusD family nutrient uptake outer membrane protein [Bacteroidales bacterium]|nr:RagB/SusD family nutrient uptake outer membrane protein [Bacteroidales bacterium]